jgi:hypothetical protein
MIMDTIFFLRNYDLYEPVLRYDANDGTHQLLTREAVVASGLKKNRGAFVEEAGQVFGIYASPQGPVLFHDSDRVLFNATTMQVKVDLDSSTNIHRYSVTENGNFLFGTHYKDRPGIGVNPYDQEPEDVDLFQMIAALLHRPPYTNYTKEWT